MIRYRIHGQSGRRFRRRFRAHHQRSVSTISTQASIRLTACTEIKTNAEATMSTPITSSTDSRLQIREVKQPRFASFARIRRCEAYCTSYRAVCKIPIIGTECSVCNGPLSKWISDRLVISPSIRIGRVVHSNSKVLGAREEEIAIIRELT